MNIQPQPFHLMLAVDGSEHSTAALSLLADLALPPGSRVTVVSVLTRRHTPDEAGMKVILAQACKQIEPLKLDVHSWLLSGHPAEELTRLADEEQPDLLIVGAKGLHATLGVLLGGVAQQVVEHASRPVMIVRAPYKGLKRVLLLVDGSACSLRAAEYLGRFPLPESTTIQVINVLQPLPMPDMIDQPWAGQMMPSPMPAMRTEDLIAWEKAEQQEGQRQVSEAAAILARHGKPAAEPLLHGNPAPELLAYARQNDASLIVAGSRGLSQVRGWLLGSLSRKLIHYAGCSVLLVKSSDCGPGNDGNA